MTPGPSDVLHRSRQDADLLHREGVWTDSGRRMACEEKRGSASARIDWSGNEREVSEWV